MKTPIRSCFNCGNRSGCAGCTAEMQSPMHAACATGEDRPSHWQPAPEIAEMSDALDLAMCGLRVAAELLTRNLRFILAFDTQTLNADLTEDEQHEADAIVERLLERAAAELRRTAAVEAPEKDETVGVEEWCSVEDVERLLAGTDIWVDTDERANVIRDAIVKAWRGIRAVFPTVPERTPICRLAHTRLAGAFAWACHAPHIGDRKFGSVGYEHIGIYSRACGADLAARWFNDALRQLNAMGADPKLIQEVAE